MGLLGRKVTCLLAVTALLAGCPALRVLAKGDFALQYEKPEGEYYMLRKAREDMYEAAAGDSLWKIAERLWGDGRLYGELYAANRELIRDPNRIYPGQTLCVSRPFYLEKQSGPIGMKSESVYQFDTPRGCTVGMLYGEETSANFTLFGGEEGYNIACLIRERENAPEGAEDYEVWKKAVSDYAEEMYRDTVDNLAFECYLSENNEIVYLYSYTYIIDLSRYGTTGRMETEVCAGLKRSGHMQAEFVGFSIGGEDIRDKVRYVTASFEELLPEGAECTVNDENMQISPSVKWEASSFNAVAWVDGYFDDKLKDLTGYREKEKSSRERLLDRMRERKGTYGGKKETGD